jgi:hypothetical protein
MLPLELLRRSHRPCAIRCRSRRGDDGEGAAFFDVAGGAEGAWALQRCYQTARALPEAGITVLCRRARGDTESSRIASFLCSTAPGPSPSRRPARGAGPVRRRRRDRRRPPIAACP